MWTKRLIFPLQIFPKTIFSSSPTTKQICGEKSWKTCTMAFLGHWCNHLTKMLASHPLGCVLYIFEITWFQMAKLSLGNLHNHFPNRAWFCRTVFPNPKPLNSFGLHTMSQLIRWSFLPSLAPNQRKSLCNFSIFEAIDNGIMKRDKK